MGSSGQSVPSLSKTAMRSAGGTKSEEPCFVTFATNALIDRLAAPSFHEGSGSVSARADALKSRIAQSASTSAIRTDMKRFIETLISRDLRLT